MSHVFLLYFASAFDFNVWFMLLVKPNVLRSSVRFY